VVRENLLPGAILTRVASSHIRVGTFQYIAAKQNINDLTTLVDYTVERHYPEIQSSKNKALRFIKSCNGKTMSTCYQLDACRFYSWSDEY
jgi:uncharacterized protein YdiU (UPF0061 family)